MVFVTRYGVTPLMWGQKIRFQEEGADAFKSPLSGHFDDMKGGKSED